MSNRLRCCLPALLFVLVAAVILSAFSSGKESSTILWNLLYMPNRQGPHAPAVKKQWVFLLSDPEGRMPKDDFAGWVLQIPENESPATTQDRIFRSAYDYNMSKKGRLYPAKTVGEALENVPAKFFKEVDVWVKTKTPVLVLKTDNEIPKE